MKSVIFGTALLLASAAVAQPTEQTTTTTTTPMETGSTVTPSNANPETDARGIAVISAPAVAPAGWNMPPGTAGAPPASATPPSMGAATDLPPCTRTVTDRCVQTYERGTRRPG